MKVDKDSDRNRPRILIVGGVAGGASCAARARRLSEKAEIIIFERGSYVSFANCGLPYYVGDIIKPPSLRNCLHSWSPLSKPITYMEPSDQIMSKLSSAKPILSIEQFTA